MDSSEIPERIWNLMDPRDREEHDRIQRAHAEKVARNLRGREIQEQRIFNTWLNNKRLERKLHTVNPRSDKATTIHKGHPDYTVFLPRGRVLLLEMKVEGGVLTPEQTECITLLHELDHKVEIPWSAAQAIEQVKRFL